MEHKALNSGARKGQIVGCRKYHQQYRICSYVANLRSNFRIVRVIIMGSGDKFRDPGGTAGELEDGWILRVDRDSGKLRDR